MGDPVAALARFFALRLDTGNEGVRSFAIACDTLQANSLTSSPTRGDYVGANRVSDIAAMR